MDGVRAVSWAWLLQRDETRGSDTCGECVLTHR